MKHNTFELLVNNRTLHGELFTPEQPKATIVLIHGMGEHLGRYISSVIPNLISNDFAIVTYDQFGHGKTVGKKGHTKNYQELLDSVEQAINKAKSLHPSCPVFLYGHSMGGNVAINYALRKQHDLKGVIATSPLLRLAFTPPKWKLSLGRLMLNILPSITLPSELDATGISRNVDEVKRYKEDVLVHDKISPVYTFPVFDAGEYAISNAEKLSVPMLLCHGTGDKITSYKASEVFANNSTMVDIKLFKDGYHELHHDLCAKDLLKEVTSWLNSKM